MQGAVLEARAAYSNKVAQEILPGEPVAHNDGLL